ncbi:MAG: hypothetical protein H8K07_22955 [Nitrospira sp.]|jgi:uncharacterized membrane protein|nr:hypothetical protein [Nitrospira sp.]MDI3465259.1 hypothetical protein [Nitrospira sp.]
MSKALLELLDGLRLQFRGLRIAFQHEFAKLGEVVGPLAAKLESLVEFLTERFALLIIKIHGTDLGMGATSQLNHSLSEALRTDYEMVAWVLFGSVVVLVISIALLAFRWVTRGELRIFISYNDASRGDVAKELEQCLNAEKKIKAKCKDFQSGIANYALNKEICQKIEECDSFVCLAGDNKTYVEYEVAWAKGARKPITLLISEHNGTVPDTTHWYFPVFRLERTRLHQFMPLVTFLRHTGGDYRSTWYLCKQALCHPFSFGSSRRAVLFGGICFLVVWAACAFDVIIHGRNLTQTTPVTAEPATYVLIHMFFLGLLAVISLVVCAYVLLFTVTLLLQLIAYWRARMDLKDAQFRRDDWEGLIPGLSPGGPLYECLFESVLPTHHDAEREGT